jgi:putative transposase
MGGLNMAGKAGMERWHQRDRGQWQALIGRQAGSGLSVADFCRRESISTASFYRWRRLLDGGLEQQVPRAPTPGFVELGLLRPVSDVAEPAGRLELTLDLGGGLVLHLVRG